VVKEDLLEVIHELFTVSQPMLGISEDTPQNCEQAPPQTGGPGQVLRNSRQSTRR
jgi:hypothetical protein